MLPTSMATPLPSMLAAWLMEVAVVRWSGGNHWLEMRGGAAMIVTPLTPFRMAQAWQLYNVKVSLINNLCNLCDMCDMLPQTKQELIIDEVVAASEHGAESHEPGHQHHRHAQVLLKRMVTVTLPLMMVMVTSASLVSGTEVSTNMMQPQLASIGASESDQP